MNERRTLNVVSGGRKWPNPATVIVIVVVAFLAASPVQAKEKPPFIAEVVSSAASQVTGGDARLHILVPKVTPLQQVEVLVNGVNQADRFAAIDGTRTLTGVVDGLDLGQVCIHPPGYLYRHR